MQLNHEDLVRQVCDERLRANYIYVFDVDRWMKYDGTRWVRTTHALARAEVGDWAYTYYRNGGGQFWDAVCSYESQQAIIHLAEAHLNRFAHELDTHPHLVNCPNGTVDLRTGELRPHRRGDLLTRVTPVEYVPDFSHPDWDKALSAVPGEYLDWYQLRIGQALTGEMTPDGKILFQVGSGANGKSALMDALLAALGGRTDGGYAILANRSVLAAGANPTSGINSALASFEGVRMAVVEELDDGHYLSTTAIKSLADTSHITARQPWEREHEFRATHTLLVNSNYQPSIADTDDGTWRRLLLLNFPYKFEAVDARHRTNWHREPDETLKARLRDGVEQRQAALSWAVAGAVAYHTAEGAKRFRDVPASLSTQTREWRLEQDLMMSYVESHIVFDGRSAVRPNDLRHHFNEWAASLGHKPLTSQKFNSRFAGHTLVTSRNDVERNRVMNTATLKKIISYPRGFDGPKLADKASSQKVWFGFRFRTDADDALDAGPMFPDALGRNRYARLPKLGNRSSL